MKNSKLKYLAIGISSMLGCVLATGAFAQQGGQVTQRGKVTIFTPSPGGSSSSDIDFKNAKPMPLPRLRTPPGSPTDSAAATYPGAPGFSAGSQGNGITAPRQLFQQSDLLNSTDADSAGDGVDDGGIIPQEYGTSYHPFTTSRVDISIQNSRYMPYRPAGKLYFKIGTGTYVCSASLIKRGVIVTAAHCVAEWGKKRFYSGWQFVPAQYGGSAPYGTWDWATAIILSSYYQGSPNLCSPVAQGVVCEDDVAVIRLAPQRIYNPPYPGTATGWYGYGYDGYGFTPYYGQAQLTQLGYPVSHDAGRYMQRTESMGFTGANYLKSNTVIGSRQTGGSSGGPWLVNLGSRATLSGTSYGYDAVNNVVVGVTSWGYNSTSPKQQGASPFLSTNIRNLVNSICAGSPTPPSCL